MVRGRESEVAIVGAGAVGLLTADRLVRSFIPPSSIRVIDADPAPHPTNTGYSGTTFRGGDARQVSLFESTVVGSPETAELLVTPTSQKGWLAIPEDELTPAAKEWITQFTKTAHDQKKLRENALRLKEINARGVMLWGDLRRETPDLFKQSGLQGGPDNRVPMFYSKEHKEQLREDFQSEKDFGLDPRELTPLEIERDFPSLQNALDRGLLVGAYAPESFAFYAKTFFTLLTEKLKRAGVKFTHDTPISHIRVKDNGDVASLESESGELIHADNYIISPGVPSNGLFEGTGLEGKIMGMAGVWVIVPEKYAPKTPRSYKGSQAHLNVTAHGEHVLYSGEYGYVGEKNVNKDAPGIRDIIEDFHTMLVRMLPELAGQGAKWEERVCRRPMTSDQLPLFTSARTDTGGVLVVAAGNGAAGVTQAPAMANAARDELRGIKSRDVLLFSRNGAH